ncbi:MAG: hypothetical protein J1F36_04495 [Clostridiales bacterium]|nr:hypothetical protein [Clostridiales bacterium]
MNNEVNNLAAEIAPPPDMIRPEEIAEIPSTHLPDSSKRYKEHNSGSGKKSAVSRFAMSAAVLAIVTALFLPATNSISAEFVYLSSTDTTVSYEILLSELDLSNLDDISVVLYNDFTKRVERVGGVTASGEITGLKPNMSYTIAIKSGNKTIVKQSIRTKKA